MGNATTSLSGGNQTGDDSMTDSKMPGPIGNGKNAYQVLQRIGGGGDGVVFSARHIESGKTVAIKHLMHPGYNFASFVHMLKRLPEDSAIVKVIDYVKLDAGGYREEQFVVMEYLPERSGFRSLRDAIRSATTLRNGTLPLADVLCAFKTYARGLRFLHANVGWPNAIKPSALYYDEANPEESKIMDFNWPLSDERSCFPMFDFDFNYVSPEASLADSRRDARMDIYALGLCFYEALSGQAAYPRLPAGKAAFAALWERIKSKTPPTFDSPLVMVNPKLLALLQNMTNIDPEKRIRDAAEVERRIVEILDEQRKTCAS